MQKTAKRYMGGEIIAGHNKNLTIARQNPEKGLSFGDTTIEGNLLLDVENLPTVVIHNLVISGNLVFKKLHCALLLVYDVKIGGKFILCNTEVVSSQLNFIFVNKQEPVEFYLSGTISNKKRFSLQ